MSFAKADRSETDNAARIWITEDPFVTRTKKQPFWLKGTWRSHWIRPKGQGAGNPRGELALPAVMAFRRRFTVAKATTVRIHVSADERYVLYLNGRRIGRGSERGAPHRWFYESYELKLSAGAHTLVAVVWALGDLAPGNPGHNPQYLGSSYYGALSPTAQMSTQPGFICAPEEEAYEALVGTGVAAWEAKFLAGYAWREFFLGAQLTGAKLDLTEAPENRGVEAGAGEGWRPALTMHPGMDGARGNDRTVFHALVPATLPASHSAPLPRPKVLHTEALGAADSRVVAITAKNHNRTQAAQWEKFLAGGEITIPAQATWRVILGLDTYYCAYHGIDTVGGGNNRDGGKPGRPEVRLHWAESLFEDTPPSDPAADLDRWCPRWKGQRDALEGKYFVGMGDRFYPTTGRATHFESLWWHAGRYLEIQVRTGAEPLTLRNLYLEETRYPLEAENRFDSSDATLRAIEPMLTRVLQCCAHETYVDCPYYEQLMYVGDTRVEVLTTYALTHDDRLPRKAIDTFDASRLPNGLTQSRYPCRVQQVIPPFSLWWVVMVHDYAYWRDDPMFVRRMLPGVRGVIDYFLSILDGQGLVRGPNGWNFMDWVPGWKDGIPPDGEYGASGPINWLALLAVNAAGDLERLYGDQHLAARAERVGSTMAQSLVDGFYDPKRGLFADDTAHTIYSEHSQCLALLSERIGWRQRMAVAQNLFTAQDLNRATIYFTHYLFEACRLCDRMDVFFRRLQFWRDLQKQGFATTVECPEPSRSDCHAWGAHPLFHACTTILGIRPAAPGFGAVTIAPHLGPLQFARGSMPHPRGEIAVDLRVTSKDGGGLTGRIALPRGITGRLEYAGRTLLLKPGQQRIAI